KPSSSAPSCAFARRPTITSVAWNHTTDGCGRSPFALSVSAVARSPSTNVTRLFVVPKSSPTISAIRPAAPAHAELPRPSRVPSQHVADRPTTPRRSSRRRHEVVRLGGPRDELSSASHRDLHERPPLAAPPPASRSPLASPRAPSPGQLLGPRVLRPRPPLPH